jgi:fatty-acyl-CoA synthase
MKPEQAASGIARDQEAILSVRYYDWIAHFSRRTPDKIALVDLASGRRLSYSQLKDRASRLAVHLRDVLKIARGDRVAVLALNTTDTLEVQFACGRLGAVMVPLNTRLTVPELQFIVGDASPKVMIHDNDLAETALTVAKLCNVSSALLLGLGGSYEAAIAGAKPLEKFEDVSLDDISTIMYTSGTTGLPKGAIITHGMTFWNCVNLGGPAYISPSSVLLTVLPLFHTGGLNCYTNPVLHAGGTVLIMRTFEPGEALKLISDPAVGINVFFGVPSIYQFMAQHASFASSDFSRLVIGGVGGAPMPVPLLKVWEARGVALQQGYGMTETSPSVMVLDKEDAARKAGSCGPTAATPLSANSASSGSRDLMSRRVTGTGRMPTNHPSPTAGCTPAMPRAWTRKVSTTSSTAGRTCTSPAAKTSIRRKSRACCINSPPLRKPPSLAFPTSSGARLAWRSSR